MRTFILHFLMNTIVVLCTYFALVVLCLMLSWTLNTGNFNAWALYKASSSEIQPFSSFKPGILSRKSSSAHISLLVSGILVAFFLRTSSTLAYVFALSWLACKCLGFVGLITSSSILRPAFFCFTIFLHEEYEMLYVIGNFLITHLLTHLFTIGSWTFDLFSNASRDRNGFWAFNFLFCFSVKIFFFGSIGITSTLNSSWSVFPSNDLHHWKNVNKRNLNIPRQLTQFSPPVAVLPNILLHL